MRQLVAAQRQFMRHRIVLIGFGYALPDRVDKMVEFAVSGVALNADAHLGAANFFGNGGGDPVKLIARAGGDADGVGIDGLNRFLQLAVGDAVGFVQHNEHFFFRTADILEYRFNTFDLVEHVRAGSVHHV